MFAALTTNITQAAGTSKRCILAKLLERHAKGDGSYENEDELKEAMAGLYLGVFRFPITSRSLALNQDIGGVESVRPLVYSHYASPLISS